MAKILLISSDPTTNGYLIPVLELADHTVTRIDSPEAALHLLVHQAREEKGSPPELVMVDGNILGDISPLEFQNKVRTLLKGTQPETPVLFILEEGRLTQDDKDTLKGQITYLVKPTHISAFSDFLRELRSSLDQLSRFGGGSLSKHTSLVANLAKEHLPSLLHMLSLVRASGYATLTNPRTKQTGTLHLRYGDVTKAILVDTTSSPKRRLEGTEALQALVDWEEGVFSFGRADPEKMPKGESARWVVLKCGIR